MKTIYTDNNATTQVAPEVYQAVIPYLTEDYFNPSSMYEAARGAANAIEEDLAGIHPAQGIRDHLIQLGRTGQSQIIVGRKIRTMPRRQRP